MGPDCVDKHTGHDVTAPSHHKARDKAWIAEARYRAAMLFACPVCGRPAGRRCENRRTAVDAAVPHPARMAMAARGGGHPRGSSTSRVRPNLDMSDLRGAATDPVPRRR